MPFIKRFSLRRFFQHNLSVLNWSFTVLYYEYQVSSRSQELLATTDSDNESCIGHTSRKRSIVLSDSENESSSNSGCLPESPKHEKKKVVVKCEEDAIPLPYPFTLPKYYGADVECALKAKKITNVTRKAFIGKVASAMLCYKRYPTSDDYSNVGHTIIQTYPFMKSPAGPPAVSLTLFRFLVPFIIVDA